MFCKSPDFLRDVRGDESSLGELTKIRLGILLKKHAHIKRMLEKDLYKPPKTAPNTVAERIAKTIS